jgi:hypothetical protein
MVFGDLFDGDEEGVVGCILAASYLVAKMRGGGHIACRVWMLRDFVVSSASACSLDRK